MFGGTLTGTGVNFTNDSGIWSDAAGSLSNLGLVARAGNQAPGTNTGVNFSRFASYPLINDAGHTVFWGYLTGIGVDDTNDSGIWSEAAGSLGNPALVAREGNQAPGTNTGVNFSSFDHPAINDAGQTVFRSHLTGIGVDDTNDSGIWSEAAGSLGNPALVAREGNQAPGTNTGVNFKGFANYPFINDAGQTAFWGILIGNGVDPYNNTGIWATGLDGLLTLVIRKGDLLDVDDDPLNEDFRTVATVNLHPSFSRQSGGYSSFNENGQLAFRATFTDGSSGIFVADTQNSSLLGDYNADGFVSQADLDLVLLNWGDATLPDGFDPSAIPNAQVFDNLISQNELDGVLLNWGDGTPPTPGSVNAIPEPTALTLLSLAGLALRRRSRAV